jgi:hypothetical protein
MGGGVRRGEEERQYKVRESKERNKAGRGAIGEKSNAGAKTR